MKRTRFLNFLPAALCVMMLASTSLVAPAQQQQSQPTSSIRVDASGVDTERIIHSFVGKEQAFRQALNQYSFKRDAVVQTLGMGGQVTGEYHRVSRFTFDDKGQRYEKIIFFPIPTIGNVIQLTPEDIDDLSGVQIFALEPSNIDKYNITYAGKDHIDELDLYVFDVSPKVMPDVKSKVRLFQGRVWVDTEDLQVVKVRGKGVPEGKQRFPTFETYREQIDGKYWFPTYTFSDEELTFSSGDVIRIRLRIKLSDFVRARGTAKIVEEGDIVDEPGAKPKPTPPPKKP
jgi:outer membrane lipoprotein-sorting protein